MSWEKDKDELCGINNSEAGKSKRNKKKSKRGRIRSKKPRKLNTLVEWAYGPNGLAGGKDL